MDRRQIHVELQDTVRTRLGNDHDALFFTEAEFSRLAAEAQPVVSLCRLPQARGRTPIRLDAV